jgi:hypothetical protein
MAYLPRHWRRCRGYGCVGMFSSIVDCIVEQWDVRIVTQSARIVKHGMVKVVSQPVSDFDCDWRC